MENIMTWHGNNPLTIKIKGNGKYVKDTCSKLVEIFEDAEYDHQLELRQESENITVKDNDYEQIAWDE